MRSLLKTTVIVYVGLIVLSPFVIGFLLIFGTALGQEKDTSDILLAIAKMHLQGKGAMAVNATNQRWIMNNEADFKRIQTSQGWQYDTQLGSARFYEQDKTLLLVDCEQFSSRYLLCDLHVQPKSQPRLKIDREKLKKSKQSAQFYPSIGIAKLL